MCRLQGGSIREHYSDGIQVALFVDNVGMFDDEVPGSTGISQCIAGGECGHWLCRWCSVGGVRGV